MDFPLEQLVRPNGTAIMAAQRNCLKLYCLLANLALQPLMAQEIAVEQPAGSNLIANRVVGFGRNHVG